MARLTCKECGAPAKVEDGVVVRTCAHDKVPVVADMKATARGAGGMR